VVTSGHPEINGSKMIQDDPYPEDVGRLVDGFVDGFVDGKWYTMVQYGTPGRTLRSY